MGKCTFVVAVITAAITHSCFSSAKSSSIQTPPVISIASSNTINGCTDHKQYTFSTTDYYNKTCDWIHEDPLTRCTLQDENQMNVRDRCRATCNNCATTSKITATSTTTRSLTQYTKQKVGNFCIQDSDCYSWTCRENTCFASEECKSIKHIEGQEFHTKTINLVFIGSGFRSIDIWRHHVAKTFRAFDSFEFFDFHNPRYNAFYVDQVTHDDGFCHFNCNGHLSLLCCDVQKSREIANKCFSTSTNLQTIVIHNSDQYGGAGYRYQNLATTSTHPFGPVVAVHELGHSLFELGDEYENTQFSARSAANCDVEGCPKWNDLSEHFGVDLCQMKGCRNGNYFVGGNSFMRELDQPMGHVNLRYTCCTYLALTKGTPSYCRQYDFGEGLNTYCEKDYLGFGGPEVYREDGRTLTTDSKGKYVVVTDPVRLSLNLVDVTFSYNDVETFDGGPQLVLRREYFGDYFDIVSVCNSHLSNSTILEIELEFDTGEIKKLYYKDTDDVEVPQEFGTIEFGNVDTSIKAEVMEVVVDASKGVVIGLKITELEITLWFRIRTWVVDLFNKFFGWLLSNESNTSSLQVK